MRDIPLFTSQYGTASLILREIPYRASAYVRILEAETAEALVGECVEFCKLAGAEKIYGTGHPFLESFPFHTQILRMTRPKAGMPETDATLVPVTAQTLEAWRELYNHKMAGVPNSAYMTRKDAEQMLKSGDGYFVRRGNQLLGLGMAAGEELKAVASLVPGAGRDVTAALCRILTGEQITLEVASENRKATELYRRLGFAIAAQISAWHQIF